MEEIDTPAGVKVQDPDKEEEEAELQRGMMRREDEDEEEEEEDTDKVKVLDVDGTILRDYFTPGVEGEVPLASYVRAYQEMSKFIKKLGPIFTFVAYDAKRKLDVIKREMAGQNGQYYVDVRTMIKYEKENDLVHRSSPLSGTDVVLHLNRALEFANVFMQEIMKDDDEEERTLGQAASEFYMATLARFHLPILTGLFSGLLLLLPSRASARNKITGGNAAGEALLLTLKPEVIRSVTQTYEACQALFREHDLHNLNPRGRAM